MKAMISTLSLALSLAAATPAFAQAAPAAPTAADADAFIAAVEKDLFDYTVESAQVNWVNATYITEDTDAMAARINAVGTEKSVKYALEAAKYAGGMPGGLDNPLGARTLYLYQNGNYTLYTIYATSAPETIGSGITSGCVGLLSQDMIDLYDRTPVKTKVVVLPA